MSSVVDASAGATVIKVPCDCTKLVIIGQNPGANGFSNFAMPTIKYF